MLFFVQGKEAGAGAVDEEDFIKAFEDVPSVQVSWSENRELSAVQEERWDLDHEPKCLQMFPPLKNDQTC